MKYKHYPLVTNNVRYYKSYCHKFPLNESDVEFFWTDVNCPKCVEKMIEEVQNQSTTAKQEYERTLNLLAEMLTHYKKIIGETK